MPLDKQIEQMAAQWLIAEIAFTIIGIIFTCLLMYLTLRYAIRDGIRDAQRMDRRTTATRSRDVIAGPDMRAD